MPLQADDIANARGRAVQDGLGATLFVLRNADSAKVRVNSQGTFDLNQARLFLASTQ